MDRQARRRGPGNQVSITRDYVSGSDVQHSKLTVDFDDRISTGAVALPGLPGTNGDKDAVTVLFWGVVRAD